MRGLFEALTEAPIGDIHLRGDFDAPGSMDYEGDKKTGAPKKLVQMPAYQHALRRFFQNCPIKVHIHFANLPNVSYFSSTKMSNEEAQQFLQDKNIEADPKAINLVLISNQGDDAVPLTPWIVAHRLSHAMAVSAQGENDNSPFDKYWYQFIGDFEEMSRLLVVPLGEMRRYAPPGAIISMLGTTKMARDGKASRIGEWFHDSVAQYILNGKITLLPSRKARNDVPFTVSQGWGYPSGQYTINPDADFDRIDAIARRAVKKAETWAQRLLRQNVGPHFLVI